jgi:nucleotide-binding universal stress UspA family protein
MAASKAYLVPIDFSRGSDAALRHAIKLARRDGSKLVLVHVISTRTVYPPEEMFFSLQEIFRKTLRRVSRNS